MLGFLGWAAVLFAQNYSFTYVSRARNSGSLNRHLKAALFSNGIWIFSQMMMLGPMFDYLTGKHGLPLLVVAGAIYTVSTVAGSITAHIVAQRTEKGKDRVGAHKDVAQFTTEEGVIIRDFIAAYRQIQTAPAKETQNNG